MNAEVRRERVRELRAQGVAYEEIARLTKYSVNHIYKILNGNVELCRNSRGAYARHKKEALSAGTSAGTPVDWNAFNPGIMSVRDSTEKIIERRSDSRYPIDPEEKHRRVHELHAQGVDCGVIADIVGYSRNYVLKIIGGHGLLKGVL